MFRSIKNLTSNDADLVSDPGTRAVPSYPRTKAEWTRYCKNQETDHCFLSGFEGIARDQRVNKSNPPVTCRGVIVDLDCPPMDLNFAQGTEPTWTSRSFSGGYHLHYVFEAPLHFGNVQGLASKFLDTIETKLRLSILPGFDYVSFRNISQYYEVGREWSGAGGLIPVARSEAWFLEAAKKFKFAATPDVVVPIDKVRKFLAEKYPNKWPGGWDAFDIGARGRRFWDDDGDALSVIVRETGLTCFTDQRGFFPWGCDELLGWEELNSYRETALTDPTKDIWFDSKQYWTTNTNQVWVCRNETQTKEDLHCAGLMKKEDEGRASEITQAMSIVRDRKQVQVSSLFYTAPGVIERPGSVHVLNVADVSALAPATKPSTGGREDWGDGFPWLAKFFDQWLGGEASIMFLAHLSHAYKCGVNRAPSRGLGVILAGPVGAGKTFAVNAVCGPLLGGCADASSYLVDGDKYNSELIETPVWSLDDVANSGNWGEQSRFSKMFKRIIANDGISCRAMYRAPYTTRWTGRIYMTANDDYESINALPRTDINILDKLLFLKTNAVKLDPWINDEDLARELPHFGAWLLAYSPPPAAIGGRFGVKPWLDPRLGAVLEDLDPKAAGMEIIARFREELDEPWTGTSSDLYDMIVTGSSSSAAKTFSSVRALNWHIKELLSRGAPGVSRMSRSNRGARFVLAPLTPSPNE